MSYKICSRCNQNLDLEFFKKISSSYTKLCKKCLKESKIKISKKFENIDLTEYIANSKSFRDLANRLDMSHGKPFNDYIRSLGIDISHFTQSYPNSTKYKKHIGKKFGKLIILTVENKIINFNQGYYSLCLCDCGNKKEILTSRVVRKITTSCGCYQKAQLSKAVSGSKNKNWTGIGEIPGTFFNIIKNSAKDRGISYNVSREYLWNMYIKQDRKCALSGIEIIFSSSDNRSENTASLDRINSNKPYEEGNVQWVHKKINIMKNNLSDEEFIELCNLVVNFNKNI